jgi:hypothetical protein
MSNKTLWVDNDGLLQQGERGFLVRNHHNTKGWDRYYLRNNPPKTNVSVVQTTKFLVKFVLNDAKL